MPSGKSFRGFENQFLRRHSVGAPLRASAALRANGGVEFPTAVPDRRPFLQSVKPGVNLQPQNRRDVNPLRTWLTGTSITSISPVFINLMTPDVHKCPATAMKPIFPCCLAFRYSPSSFSMNLFAVRSLSGTLAYGSPFSAGVLFPSPCNTSCLWPSVTKKWTSTRMLSYSIATRNLALPRKRSR